MEILSLGEKIRRKRKSLRLTLKDVAGDNVTPAQLSYVESNKCKPSSNLLKYICSKIDLDLQFALESECQQAAKYCDYYLKEYEFYTKRGELNEALSKLSEVEKLSEEYGLERYLGIVSYMKGIDFIKKGDYNAAQHKLIISLQIFMRFDDREYLYNCYRSLGQVSLKKNHLNDALEFYNRSLETGLTDKGNSFTSYHILLNIAKIHYKMGNAFEAEKYLSKVISGVQEFIGDIEEQGSIMEILELSSQVFTISAFSKYENVFRNFLEAVNNRSVPVTLDIIKSLIYMKGQEYEKGIELLYKVLDQTDNDFYEHQINYLLRMTFMIMGKQCEHAQFILDKISGAEMNSEQYLSLLYLQSLISKDTDINKSLELLSRAVNEGGCDSNKYLSVLINNQLGELYKQEKCYQDSIKCLLTSAQLLSMPETADYGLLFYV